MTADLALEDTDHRQARIMELLAELEEFVQTHCGAWTPYQVKGRMEFNVDAEF